VQVLSHKEHRLLRGNAQQDRETSLESLLLLLLGQHGQRGIVGSQREREGFVMQGVKTTMIESDVIPGCPYGIDSVNIATSVAMFAL
jgi:hypothetical protein